MLASVAGEAPFSLDIVNIDLILVTLPIYEPLVESLCYIIFTQVLAVLGYFYKVLSVLVRLSFLT